MTWFSEYRVRTLATNIAPRIMPSVIAAVDAAIRNTIAAELPALLFDELQREIPEFMPKTTRRERTRAILAEFNGRNQRALATKYGMSRSQIYRIVSGSK